MKFAYGQKEWFAQKSYKTMDLSEFRTKREECEVKSCKKSGMLLIEIPNQSTISDEFMKIWNTWYFGCKKAPGVPA